MPNHARSLVARMISQLKALLLRLKKKSTTTNEVTRSHEAASQLPLFEIPGPGRGPYARNSVILTYVGSDSEVCSSHDGILVERSVEVSEEYYLELEDQV